MRTNFYKQTLNKSIIKPKLNAAFFLRQFSKSKPGQWMVALYRKLKQNLPIVVQMTCSGNDKAEVKVHWFERNFCLHDMYWNQASLELTVRISFKLQLVIALCKRSNRPIYAFTPNCFHARGKGSNLLIYYVDYPSCAIRWYFRDLWHLFGSVLEKRTPNLTMSAHLLSNLLDDSRPARSRVPTGGKKLLVRYFCVKCHSYLLCWWV